MQDTQKEAETYTEGEAAPWGEPHVRLDSRNLRSWPKPKADTHQWATQVPQRSISWSDWWLWGCVHFVQIHQTFFFNFSVYIYYT